MGRLLMSHRLADFERDSPVPNPVLATPIPQPEPEIVYWSASNAFDPDSDEFWSNQEVVYEAFLDLNDIRAATPGSSDDERGTPSPAETIIVDGAQLMTSPDAPSRVSLAQVLAIAPSDLSQSNDDNFSIEILPDLLPTRPVTPDNNSYSMTMPGLMRTPTTPMVNPSPAPTVTPHIYTWDTNHMRSTRDEIAASLSSATSPSAVQELARRMRSRFIADPRSPTTTHRRRESLPASISLMG